MKNHSMLRIFAHATKKKMQKPVIQEQTSEATALKENALDKEITDEKVAAAIMALHFHFEELNYAESEVITIIEPLSVGYSPWSQKHLVMKKVQRK